MKKTEVFYTVYNSHRGYIDCSKDKEWAEYARERHNGYIIASNKFIENPEVVKFKRKRKMKRIELVLWTLLCVMMTVNFAWMAYLGHSWSAVVSGILALVFYRIVILTTKENRG
jgi:hypothetical protein